MFARCPTKWRHDVTLAGVTAPREQETNLIESQVLAAESRIELADALYQLQSAFGNHILTCQPDTPATVLLN